MQVRMFWIAVLAIGCADFAQAQSSRRYYTEARIQTMRANLEKHEWARKQRDDIFAKANRWARYDDEKLRTLVIPPQVPRCYEVSNQGCPIHGVGASYTVDFDRPFKVKCRIGGEEYPSNDFAAFLASGLKDRSLLTGDYADDGWGWHKPGDKSPANYWFVAYYAQGCIQYLLKAIENLSTAAILTEDADQARMYAHKCALLLWQLSVYYPDYEYASQSREGKEHNPEYTGKLLNRIWETWTPQKCAPAYDAIRPFLAADVELQKLTGKSATEIDTMIRERLLHEAVECIMDGSTRIFGNYGMHQRALLILALVLNEKQKHPTSEEMIQFVLDNPKPIKSLEMGLRDAFINLIYRDGMPPESIGYNTSWNLSLTDIAEMLAACGVDVFNEPQFRRLLSWPFNVYIAGQFSPPMGDSGDMFARRQQWKVEACSKALRHVDDPRLAWAVKQRPDVAQDLFSEPIDDILAKYENQPSPVIGFNSYLFPAYGLANLQCGSDANRVANSFFFGSHRQHMHHDQLNMLLFAHDNALLVDIGYPEQTDRFNHRLSGYFVNTIAHNTVTVDASKQGRGPGCLHGFAKDGFAQVVDASCEGTYPDHVSLYRRANMLVEVTDEHSYLFDVFYVRGGSQHDYSAHGTQADFFCDPPLGPVQQEGSLAGIDVPYEQFYDDAELKDKPLGSVNYGGYTGSGFQFLTNVQRMPLKGKAIGDWRLTEPLKGQPDRPWKEIGLRAHLVGSNEEVIACDGPMQRWYTMPKTVKCLIRRRTGENLSSCFTTVYEPYKGKTWIKQVSPISIEPNDGQATAALVELADGAKHYLFHSLTPEQKYVLDGHVTVTGQTACLVLDAQNMPTKSMLLNGTQLAIGDYTVKGKGLRRSKIASVDYARGIIELADPILGEDVGPDTVLLVRGKGFNDCVTVGKVIDPTHFAIGDEDLILAGGPIKEVRDHEIVTSVHTRYAREGMTVLNSRLEPVGRLGENTDKDWRYKGWMIDRETPLTPEDFPQKDGDSSPRYYVVMAGAGDEIIVPHYLVRQ